MKRCIMLDIDGVLNSHRTAIAYGQTLHRKLDPVAVAILYHIVTNADAKIVISSSWRYGPDWLTLIWGCLREAGWPCDSGPLIPSENCPIIDRTPLVGGSIRGDKIDQWLKNNPEYNDYIILDDNSDMLESQKDRFIKCDEHVGLGWEQWEQICKIWPEVEQFE